jgi:hypothetical protein
MCVATVKWATMQTGSSPFGASLGTQAGPAVVPGDADAKDGATGAKDADKTPPKSPPAEDNAKDGESGSPTEK